MGGMEMEEGRDLLEKTLENDRVPSKLKSALLELYSNYREIVLNQPNVDQLLQLFNLFVGEIINVIDYPPHFEIFHQAVRKPFDYYQMGLDFIRPCIDFDRSKLRGTDSLKKIDEQLKNGDNVFLLANHQIEPDPQVISLMLEHLYPKIAEEMIFIAGHRVITDPMAIPMSMGRNLLCIYSKKHIAFPSEEKERKILHNRRTIAKMVDLLKEGGKCIYVAPSGGRDRPSSTGVVEVAPFDPQSIELFYLIARQSDRTTHFYPLALNSYPLMPPPDQVEKEVGEKRKMQRTPIFLAFGEEVDMEHFPGSENIDKLTKRKARANYIWNQVRKYYSLKTGAGF
jgi:glycerol-3-phosphate O-acyltransferase